MASSKSKLSTSSITPAKPKFKPASDAAHANSTKTDLDTIAKQDAERLAEERIRIDPDMLAMAYSQDEAARGVSVESTELVVKALESLLLPSPTDEVAELPSEFDNPALRDKLAALTIAFRPWLLPLNDAVADKLSKEKPIYSYFRDVVLFVMECLKTLHPASDAPQHYRLLLPNSTGGDSKGKDSTQEFKVDQVLVLRPWSDEIGQGVARWHYTDILAVMEAKVPDSAAAISKATSPPRTILSSFADSTPPPVLKKAQGQMLCYSRQIYERQHNRLLLWGLTCCGSLVRVYNSGPDCALSSADLDMRDAGGRRQFIEWLVNMSLGEGEQRGFNSAVQLVDSSDHGKYWKIDVPASDDEGYQSDPTHFSSYYSRGPTVVAGSSFGRNTRGFPASRDVSYVDKPDVFVKTAWQHAERGTNPTRPSELDCLRLIAKKFGAGQEGINVPLLVAGGVMAKRLEDGAHMLLTTDAFYSDAILKRHGVVEDFQTGSRSVEDDEPNPLAEQRLPPLIAFRRHYVLVTKRICEPLSTVKTADELIIVLSDAMRAHSWVLEHCSLLHRDISPNNIMVGRNETTNGGPPVYGMLIDFDCAIDPNMERVARPERTGTKPFMSVPNLEGHPEQRTELDDWESLIYVVCWVATFGINADNRKILAESHRKLKIPLEISLWHADHDMAAIAAKKRSHLHDLEMFTTNIAKRFSAAHVSGKLPDYSPLQRLAINLYVIMFQHPKVDRKCRGSLKVTDTVALFEGAMYGIDPSPDGGPLELLRNMTIQPSSSTDSPADPASSDPFVNRTEPLTKATITGGLKGALAHHATLANARIAALSPT